MVQFAIAQLVLHLRSPTLNVISFLCDASAGSRILHAESLCRACMRRARVIVGPFRARVATSLNNQREIPLRRSPTIKSGASSERIPRDRALGLIRTLVLIDGMLHSASAHGFSAGWQHSFQRRSSSPNTRTRNRSRSLLVSPSDRLRRLKPAFEEEPGFSGRGVRPFFPGGRRGSFFAILRREPRAALATVEA